MVGYTTHYYGLYDPPLWAVKIIPTKQQNLSVSSIKPSPASTIFITDFEN